MNIQSAGKSMTQRIRQNLTKKFSHAVGEMKKEEINE